MPASPSHEESAGVRVPPPLIYVAGFLLGLGLEQLAPLAELSGSVAVVLGVIGIAAGVLLIFSSIILFQRAGTNLMPHKPTSAIVTSGPFKFTRNPIYLGFALIYAGIAVSTGVTWALIVLPVVLFVVDRAVVAREERYLERAHADDYVRYKASVRRWI